VLGVKISLSMTDIQELFEEFQQETHASHLVDDFEEQIQLPDRIGQGLIQNWHLRDGLELYRQTYQCHEETCFESSVQRSFIKLGFCISGQMRGVEPDFELRAGQSLLLARTTDRLAKTEVIAQQSIGIVEIVIPPQLLDTLLFGELLPPGLQQVTAGTASGLYAQANTITPAMATVLDQVLNCPYQGVAKQLYLESKTLELITLQFTELSDAEQKRDQRHDRSACLSAEEVERIYRAKEILLQQLSNPPSLLALSRQVGLNDYKLKLGFRQVFGTTAFGCLHQHRMEQARQLLTTSSHTLEFVAQSVGYASVSSFHRAFKKQFGVNPGEFRRS
jgi:AraC family transcriptional regulator, transcriptional activator of the genes for pyochelin and ferripyochelin receptors